VLLYTLCHGRLPFESTQQIIAGSYAVSEHLADEPAGLIRAILVCDPARRLPLDQVRAHAWTALGAADVAARLPARQRLGGTRAEPSERLLRTIERVYGYAADLTRESLKARALDHASATYMLLEDAGVDDDDWG
jgi:hypothetical protein